MRRLLKRFWASESGNFAIISALSLVPVVGLAGLGLDFSQAYSTRTTLQGEADAIAIAVASEGPGVESRFYEAMKGAAVERVALGDATFEGTWITEVDYQVTAKAKVPRTLSRVLPVGGDMIDVAVESVARYMGARLVYKTPESMLLDPEAWDYNRVDAYCYNAELGRNNPAAGRGKSVAIADNADGKYDDPIPQCGAGEVLSFELYNIIEGKHSPKNMTNPSKLNRYYTDTTRDANGTDTHNLIDDLLETVLCPSLSVCHSDPGGMIPKGKYRTPQKNTKPCSPGMYMYYGWEDRPVGDRDYDDIRIIIECPKLERVGEESVRLMR